MYYVGIVIEYHAPLAVSQTGQDSHDWLNLMHNIAIV